MVASIGLAATTALVHNLIFGASRRYATACCCCRLTTSHAGASHSMIVMISMVNDSDRSCRTTCVCDCLV